MPSRAKVLCLYVTAGDYARGQASQLASEQTTERNWNKSVHTHMPVYKQIVVRLARVPLNWLDFVLVNPLSLSVNTQPSSPLNGELWYACNVRKTAVIKSHSKRWRQAPTRRISHFVEICLMFVWMYNEGEWVCIGELAFSLFPSCSLCLTHTTRLENRAGR